MLPPLRSEPLGFLVPVPFLQGFSNVFHAWDYRTRSRTIPPPSGVLVWYNEDMTPKLNDELIKALEQHSDGPVPVEHPGTKKMYFIISSEQMERVRALFDPDDAFDISESYGAQEAVARGAGWEDPEMDVYNDHDADQSQG